MSRDFERVRLSADSRPLMVQASIYTHTGTTYDKLGLDPQLDLFHTSHKRHGELVDAAKDMPSKLGR